MLFDFILRYVTFKHRSPTESNIAVAYEKLLW